MNAIQKHYQKISKMGAEAVARKYGLRTKAQKRAYYQAVRAGKKIKVPVDNPKPIRQIIE